jgi:hypothetical protein
MAGALLVAVIAALILAVGAAAALWGRDARRAAAAADSATADQATAAVAAHLRRARWTALPLALLAGFLAVTALDEHAVYAVVPAAALAAIVCWAVAELTAPLPPREAVRAATLAPRDLGHYVSATRMWLMRAAELSALAVVAVAALLAAADGESVAITCAEGGSTHSPFPGLGYTAVGVALLLAVGVMTEVALRRITTRPDPAGETAQPADALLRRASATAIARITTAAAVSTVTGVALVAGFGLLDLDGPCPAGGRHAVGWLLVGVAAASAIVLLTLLVDAGRSAGTRTLRTVASADQGAR